MPESRPLDARQRLRVIAVLGMVMAPHIVRVPWWVSATTLALLAWQVTLALRGWRQPGRAVRLTLACLAFVTVYLAFGRVDGPTAGVSLLMLLLAVKLTETSGQRDLMVLLSLCCFLLITSFLFSQAIVMAGFLVLGALLLTACFVDVSHPGRALPAPTVLATAGKLMLQAVPVAVLLFVLFPRIPAPIWALPSDSGGLARSGLPDTLSFGSISRLVGSDEVAFRVRFEASPPPPRLRYWRGPVFWVFDGHQWSRGDPPAHRARPARTLLGEPVAYRLILEPGHQDFVPALALPANAPKATFIGPAGSLRTREPVTERTAYTLVSYPHYRLQLHAPEQLLAYANRLPEHGNPRARALAARWRRSTQSPQAIVAAALEHFRSQGYVYTLQPAVVSGPNHIDAFLFETREGFCAHYAGAFTFLMRAAGIPARVVTGYLGGRPGLGGDYLIVRAADAHAWSEVWLQGRGWVRVDPTAVVAPARVDAGIGASLAASTFVPYLARGVSGPLQRLRLGWDYINAAWNRWFLAYGPHLQGRFMQFLGLPGLRAMLIALTLLVTGFLLALALVLAHRAHPPPPSDPVQRAWLRLCRRLAHAGVARGAAEGPLDYARRVAVQRPHDAASVQALASRYARIRYRGADTDEREYFVRAARAYRPCRRQA